MSALLPHVTAHRVSLPLKYALTVAQCSSALCSPDAREPVDEAALLTDTEKVPRDVWYLLLVDGDFIKEKGEVSLQQCLNLPGQNQPTLRRSRCAQASRHTCCNDTSPFSLMRLPSTSHPPHGLSLAGLLVRHCLLSSRCCPKFLASTHHPALQALLYRQAGTPCTPPSRQQLLQKVSARAALLACAAPPPFRAPEVRPSALQLRPSPVWPWLAHIRRRLVHRLCRCCAD